MWEDPKGDYVRNRQTMERDLTRINGTFNIGTVTSRDQWKEGSARDLKGLFEKAGN